MENRIKKKVNNYQMEFKESIKKWIEDNNIIINDKDNNIINSDFIKYIYDYNKFDLTKDDLKKKKNSKSSISQFERCCAKKANNTQCSRRKKNNSEYCGTHINGTPYGLYNDSENNNKIKKLEIWVQDINGIQYYLDENNNIYYPEDIISNSKNPRIVKRWFLDTEGNYILK